MIPLLLQIRTLAQQILKALSGSVHAEILAEVKAHRAENAEADVKILAALQRIEEAANNPPDDGQAVNIGFTAGPVQEQP